MADPFVAEIRIFPFSFAPTGWALCDGQLLPLSQNTALFSLLGTTYGGNGSSNFALPDIQGRTVVQSGQGPGLSLYDLGQSGGQETVTLLESETPSHSHSVGAHTADPAEVFLPLPGVVLAPSQGGFAYQTAANANTTPFAPEALGVVGGDLPHNNMMPYVTFNFCIALQGVFPQRS